MDQIGNATELALLLEINRTTAFGWVRKTGPRVGGR